MFVFSVTITVERGDTAINACFSSIYATADLMNTYSALMDILVLADILMVFYSVTDNKPLFNATHIYCSEMTKTTPCSQAFHISKQLKMITDALQTESA